jgi:hypothetical protein
MMQSVRNAVYAMRRRFIQHILCTNQHKSTPCAHIPLAPAAQIVKTIEHDSDHEVSFGSRRNDIEVDQAILAEHRIHLDWLDDALVRHGLIARRCPSTHHLTHLGPCDLERVKSLA